MPASLARRLSQAVTTIIAVTGLTLSPASPASACGYNCISSPPRAYPADSSATVAFFTAVPTRVTVLVGKRVEFPAHVQSVQEDAFSTWHYVALPIGLDPNTTYSYLIRLVDESGRAYDEPSQSAHTFVTRHRQITVTFTNLYVSDDSDFWSAGDLSFSFRLHDEVKPLWYNNTSWSSGTSRDPHLTMSATDTPNRTLLAVEGADDDRDFIIDTDFCGRSPDWSSGSNSLCEWSTAVQTLYLQGIRPGFHQIQFSSPRLPRFTVTASAYVSYP